MKLLSYTSFTAVRSARNKAQDSLIQKRTATIVQAVKQDGDRAVKRLTKKYDGVAPSSLTVSKNEFSRANKNIGKSFFVAIRLAIRNQRKFQRSLLRGQSKKVQTQPGIKVWREWRPIEIVGLYIPGGRARYPSSAVMVAVPAQLAGCKRIVICTPPSRPLHSRHQCR